MINPKNGTYEPEQHWDRKLMRSVIKAQIIKKDGYNKVNKKLHYIWKQMQNGNKEVIE